MLDRRSKNIIWLFILAIGLILMIELLRPRPLDWGPSYTDTDQNTFGAYVLYQELPKVLDAKIEAIEQDPFEFLLDSTYTTPSTYFFLNDELNFDQQQVAELLDYAAAGNTVFLSARDFGYVLEDTLSTYTYIEYDYLESRIGTNFYNPNIKTDSLTYYQRGVYPTIFSEIDTSAAKILGYYEFVDQEYQWDPEINFLSYKLGEGAILLHTLPEAFSNYYLLQQKTEYPASILSYLEHKTLYWDTHMKSGRRESRSEMRFIFAQESLTWAYYVAWLGVLGLVFFKAKREQRPIPIIKPLENTSVAFAQTIGDLYFQHKDYEGIIKQRITFFLEQIRGKYQMGSQVLDQQWVERLAGKSGNDPEDVQKLVDQIEQFTKGGYRTEADLIQLNKNIEALLL